MEHEKKTKRRTYLWILLAALAFFPAALMLQPSMASYSTALQMNEGNLAVESIHPVAPNRLERFGTDPLGRHVATLLSNSSPQAMSIAVLAAFLRAVLGAVCTRLHFRPHARLVLGRYGSDFVPLCFFAALFSHGYGRRSPAAACDPLGLYFFRHSMKTSASEKSAC